VRAPVLGVGAVILDRSGAHPSVLLVKRGRPPREGSWSLPGGRVERGERLAEALRREIVEETGLFVHPGPLLAVVEIIDETYHYVVLDYLCDVLGGDFHAGDDAAAATFVAIPELATFGVTPAVRDVIDRALALVETPTTPPPAGDEPIDEPLDEPTFSDEATTADGTDPLV
jgi:ADP-ribose pyrophosphatase YjhB (NUDIX family)